MFQHDALSIIIFLYIWFFALYIITVVYIKFVVQDEEKNVKKSEDIEGYKGYQDVDAILQFIGKQTLSLSILTQTLFAQFSRLKLNLMKNQIFFLY